MPTPAPLCTHTMPSGDTCGSPAVNGNPLCYHHSALKTALGKAGAPGSPIPFVFPEDRASVQINYHLLLQAFAERRIDLRTFNSMQRLLRAMDANLAKMPLAARHPNREIDVEETPAPVNPPQKMKAFAATVSLPSAAPARHKPEPFRPAPASGKPAANAYPSFEEIAARHKPFGAECFLIAADKHPARFADALAH